MSPANPIYKCNPLDLSEYQDSAMVEEKSKRDSRRCLPNHLTILRCVPLGIRFRRSHLCPPCFLCFRYSGFHACRHMPFCWTTYAVLPAEDFDGRTECGQPLQRKSQFTDSHKHCRRTHRWTRTVEAWSCSVGRLARGQWLCPEQKVGLRLIPHMARKLEVRCSTEK